MKLTPIEKVGVFAFYSMGVKILNRKSLSLAQVLLHEGY